MNDSRKNGLLRLKHLNEASEAKAEEMAAERDRFANLADPASAARAVSSFNLFQTPEPLAKQLAGMFDRFGRTLEPSAGLGRLYQAVRHFNKDCEISLVDVSPGCCGELYRAIAGDEAARLHQGDFLTMTIDRLGVFDSIIMNPPFKMGLDIRHIAHARTFLADGGKLVSLCANGPRQRAALMPLADQWHDLPEGTFKSEGTNVHTAICVFLR